MAAQIVGGAKASAQTLRVVSERTETAVLDPANWDQVFANERYFDALRPMLVRFPGMAQRVHEKLEQGYAIERVELMLTLAEQEGTQPQRGRHGWGADGLYEDKPGKWHVEARALRRPWSVANPNRGPTFNAYIKGLGFWDRGGARGDGSDRFETLFGPKPLYKKEQKDMPKDGPSLDNLGGDGFSLDEDPSLFELIETSFDVTKLVTDPAYGDTLGRRLRAIEEHGFMLQKSEIRDMKYRHYYAYDWAVSIGYLRMWVDEPVLMVTLRRGDSDVGPLPEPTDVAQLARELEEAGGRGAPSIAYPPDRAERAAAHWQKPEGMPAWQWERINDLMDIARRSGDVEIALGRGVNYAALLFGDRETYMEAMRQLLLMPPRHWQGHLTTDFALLPTAYPDLLPEGVMDHLKLYWEAWLHPETPSRNDIGGGTHRGGPSYFRGYSDGGGTMNFGHNAVMGTLLASQLIEAKYPLAEAQQGLSRMSRGSYGLGTGAHQEIGDTYYHSITLAGAGGIAKYAQDPVDRMIGRMHRDRLVEPLISMYHPGLRRMTHPMSRGHYRYKLLLQAGPYQVLHTLSPSGAMMHTDDLDEELSGPPGEWGKVRGLQIMDNEAPPDRFAALSPWTEPYLADALASVVDGKTFPFRVHARDNSAGAYHGGWHVNYLSEHYALASRDNANENYGVTSVVAQWRRTPEQVDHVDDLSTMLLGFGSNGRYSKSALSMVEFGVVQHDNKLLAMKRLPSSERITDNDDGDIHSLHTTAMAIAFGDTSDREVWINDRRVEELSGHTKPESEKVDWDNVMARGAVVNANNGDLITIRDGVTYTALIPVVANPLARTREVELAYEHPFLMVHNFIYHDPDAPLDLNDLYARKDKPTAGFVVEMGDASQYESFEAFREHMKQASLDASWDGQKKQIDMTYRSGGDELTMSYDPTAYPAKARSVNGKWPYLPEDGLMRESSWAVQGWKSKLEKNGAVLRSEQGSRGYLLAIPEADTYVGYNPIPHLQPWSLEAPGGVEVRSAGNVGLLRVVLKPNEKALWVDQVYREDQNPAADETIARGMHLFGFESPPRAHVNGERVADLKQVEVDGRQAYFLPFDIE